MAFRTPLSAVPLALTARARRRALVEQDRRSARLAELTLIGDVLRSAQTVVDQGWLQHDWFGPDDSDPSTSACLVGAVILAAGGPGTRQSQLVQRGLDVIWHAFAEDPEVAVQFAPPSNVRMARVRHLTAWNDEARRRPEDVIALLAQAGSIIQRERAHLVYRAERSATLTAPRR